MLNILNILPPELAHSLAIFFLKNFKNFIKTQSITNSYLECKVFDFHFPNPIGLAAGFDKNAECLKALAKLGFGFLEFGTVTPNPQKGNEKPRLFRLKEDKAIINRLGFNNKGIESFLKNFNKAKHDVFLPIGINIGKNKHTEDPIIDYVELLKKVINVGDYITLNISSPNTAKLRDLQKFNLLNELLSSVYNVKKEYDSKDKILIKIAPDINDEYKNDIINLALKYKIDGIIVGNSTIGCRDNLKNRNKIEYGGLSGKPLFDLSTQNLKDICKVTKGRIALIGCGGIFNGIDAYKKIKSGANLLQIYTALIYKGPNVVKKINEEITNLLQSDGFKNISEAVGFDV